jgi:hypothetical protein
MVGGDRRSVLLVVDAQLLKDLFVRGRFELFASQNSTEADAFCVTGPASAGSELLRNSVEFSRGAKTYTRE